MLVDMKSILVEATKKGYGVVAPNVNDACTIKACFDAALETRSPMVIDAGGKLDYDFIGNVVRFYSNRYPQIPVALNLDHGANLDEVMVAIRAGFTSVMIDNSALSFEENIASTAEIVKVAHKVGVSVEAELGHVGREGETTDDMGVYTRPEEAAKFVEQTGVDCLAIAIGTTHGHYKGKPHLEIELLDEIRKAVNVPLVLHGGSSTGDENLKNAIKHGISKINIGTDLNDAGVSSLETFMNEHELATTRFYLAKATDATFDGWKEKLKHYLIEFGEKDRW